ncbi:MAG: nickel-dependent lactate racemase [Oscillospiraceae bacterium]|nr:nickel-dependent lactate racemase [Oscillospiraceae bacterium]
MIIRLPYGSGYQTLEIDDMYDVETLRSGADGGGGVGGARVGGGAGSSFVEDEDDIVLAAMAAPIGAPRLAELARSALNAVIICSDHTRPVPSRRIIPHMLDELRQYNPGIHITLLIATGMHRAPSRAELELKFGPKIIESEHIVIHDSKDLHSMRRIGRLPSGADLIINSTAADADLLVAEGFIEPHFFAGYSGGRKSVLPGICAYETVLGNHCAAFIADPAARTGELDGNPIHRDMVAAQQMAGLAFIVNVIIDANRHVLRAYAGEPVKAHARGCGDLDVMCRVAPGRAADIVITTNGGAPLDQNIYQAVKCMTAAEAAAAPGAVIIALSECADGVGGDSFFSMMRNCKSPAELLDAIGNVPMQETAEDQWEAQILARIMAKHRVILVCAEGAREAARQMKLLTAGDVNEALALALRMLPADASRSGGGGEGSVGAVGGISGGVGGGSSSGSGNGIGGERIGKNPYIIIIPDGVSVIVSPAEK